RRSRPKARSGAPPASGPSVGGSGSPRPPPGESSRPGTSWRSACPAAPRTAAGPPSGRRPQPAADSASAPPPASASRPSSGRGSPGSSAAAPTPPTMLQNLLLGAVLKRGRTDSIHDAHLFLVDLHSLDQRPHDLAPRQPARAV